MRTGEKLLFLGVLVCGFLRIMTSPFYSYVSTCGAGENEEPARELAPVVRQSNVLFCPYASIRKSLLRGDPSLARVRLRPVCSGVLNLAVICERRAATVRLRYKNRLLGLDAEGVPFFLFAPPQPGAVKEIELDSSVRLVPGEPLDDSLHRTITGMLQVLDSVQPVRFSRIILDSDGQWKFLTDTGVSIFAGREKDLLDRLKLLLPILDVIRRQKFKKVMVDLRPMDRPILKVVSR